MPDFKEKLKNLPLCPGVYLMKDEEDKIIYVGKSKALKNRVSQYFQTSKNHSPKTIAMVSNVRDFEYIITDTESEALALECNLIKKHRPKYNILLKDDKQYPYIKITNEDYPKIFITRRITKDGGRYFGPYMSSFSIKNALEIIKKIFKVRSCKLNLPRDFGKKRPCLYYHIGQCCAPCTGKISKEDYNEIFDKISEVLKGNYKTVEKELSAIMLDASERLDFEKAAMYRDKINAVKALSGEQKITSAKGGNRDVVGIYTDLLESCIQVFYFRGGKGVGSEHFTLKNNLSTPNQLVEDFVKQFYFTAQTIPLEIILPFEIEDNDGIQNWLSEKAGHKVKFTVPQKGDKLNVLKMVNKNAEESLKLEFFVRDKDLSHRNVVLGELSQLLSLDNIPHKIESYDISNISGAHSIGAQIVYIDAFSKKSLYRVYNIKGLSEPNDYESMKQTIFRRISEAYKEEDLIKEGKLEKEKAKFYPLPDLILLDGGAGHVSVVKEMLEGLGEEIPVFGLVKDDKHKTRGIVDEQTEYPVEKNSELFKFLSGMQEEVHRFAISRFRSKHEKASLGFELEKITGVGPEKRKKLLNMFGGIKRIKKAEIFELSKAVDQKTAENIYNYFHKGE